MSPDRSAAAGPADPPRLTATVAELVDRARELAQRGPRTVLGLTGAPGAGKSTVSAGLLSALGSQACAAPMDGFHLANEVLLGLGRRQRKGAVDTFDVGGFVALLQRLRAHDEEVVYAPSFDRSIETAIAGAVPVPHHVPLVITEGNYLLHDAGGWEKVRPLLDEVWFIDVPAAERVRRLVGRRTGDGEAVSDAQAWVDRVDQANAAVVTRSASRADLVVTLVDHPVPGEER
jgi:pantothenate kinase